MISSQNSVSSLLKNYSHLALYSGLGVLIGIGATKLLESVLPKDVKIKHPQNQPIVSSNFFSLLASSEQFKFKMRISKRLSKNNL